MKNTLLALAIVLTHDPSAFGQMLLQQGDTFTFAVDSVPFERTLPVPQPSFTGYRDFTIITIPQTLQPGVVLSYELFDSRTSLTPIFSGQVTGTRAYGGFTAAWPVGTESLVRLTMQSGSTIVTELGFSVWLQGASPLTTDAYTLRSSVVPEPTESALIIVGTLVLLKFLGRKYRDDAA